MQPETAALVAKHIRWALNPVSADLNTELAQEASVTQLFSLERHLRDALQVAAQLEDPERVPVKRGRRHEAAGFSGFAPDEDEAVA